MNGKQSAHEPATQAPEEHWGAPRPEGESLGLVVGSWIDLSAHTLCVATTTHDLRVLAYEDLRADEIPRVGSEAVHMPHLQSVALMSQVGAWGVMELAERQHQSGGLDGAIPPTARRAAQRSILVLALAGLALFARLLHSAAEQAMGTTAALGAAIVCLVATFLLVRRIWPLFTVPTDELPGSLVRIGRPLRRRREQTLLSQGSKQELGSQQRDWVAEQAGESNKRA